MLTHELRERDPHLTARRRENFEQSDEWITDADLQALVIQVLATL